MDGRKALAIARKDLRVEFRSRSTIQFLLLFAFITLLMFNFASPPFSPALREVGPGLLWFVFIFAGMLGLSRAFIKEKELGTLEGLMLAPVGGVEIVLGKMVYNLCLMLLVELFSLPLFLALFDYRVAGSVVDLVLVLTLGLLGFVVVGSFVSAVIMGARGRELVLQVVAMPLLLPVVIPTIMALRRVMVDGAPLAGIGEARLVLAYIIIMSTLSFLLSDNVLEE